MNGFRKLCLVGAASAAIGLLSLPIRAQQPKKVSDGVFTAEQAARGKPNFDMNCSRCHNVALIGSERGPAIKGPVFLSHWDKDTVAGLFRKIRDTMPEGGPATVKEDDKIDILSYILQQNGFPAGKTELPKDTSSLEDIRIGADTGPLNFSLVKVTGCLTERSNHRWSLANASEPVPVKDETGPPETGAKLGSESFDLISIRPAFKADTHRGHKVEVRGLLYREPGHEELNLTSLEFVDTNCR